MDAADAHRVLGALYDVFQAPSHVLEHQLQDVCVFAAGQRPTEVFSEDDPSHRLRDDPEIIPIDGYLGLYCPDAQQITIFRKAIRETSPVLEARPEYLELIVRIHEWAHAIVHLGVPAEDVPKLLNDEQARRAVLAKATCVFHAIDNDLHETLAQLLTIHCIWDRRRSAQADQVQRALEGIEALYHRLAARQSPEYQVQDLLQVPGDRIRRSVGLLQKGYLAPKRSVWKTVVTW